MTSIRGIALQGDWTPAELAELRKVMAPMPPAWIEKNPLVQVIAREPALTDGPPDAPGHSKYEPTTRSIVVYDKGVYHGGKVDPEQFRRSVYHELAHTILRCCPGLLTGWTEATRGDGFVDRYAKTAPDEDFADTFSEYFIFPGKTQQVVPQKAEFMRNLLAESQRPKEKVAMPFMNSFVDELTKTATGGALSKILSAAKTPWGKGAIAVGGAGTALEAGRRSGQRSGRKSGERAGVARGMKGMDAGMQRAYRLGVQRGAMAMRQALVRQMRTAQQRR